MPDAPSTMGSLVEEDESAGLAARSSGSGRSGMSRWSTPHLKLIAAIAMFLVAAIVLGVQIFGGEQSAAAETGARTVIDADTGEVIQRFKFPSGKPAPWINPRSGKATLHEAETCFWTRDGKAKSTPTYVLLNQSIGKAGQTICPDCGRPVVWLNPPPPGKLLDEAYEREKAGN